MTRMLIATTVLILLTSRLAESDFIGFEMRNEVWNFCQTDYCLRHYDPLNPPHYGLPR